MNRAWSLSKPPFEAIARHLKTCRGQRCRHPVQLRGRSAAAPVLSIFHRGQLIKKEEDREQKVARPHSTAQEILDTYAFRADRAGAGPCCDHRLSIFSRQYRRYKASHEPAWQPGSS